MSLSNLELSDLKWRKARRSANNGACVEVAPANGQVPLPLTSVGYVRW